MSFMSVTKSQFVLASVALHALSFAAIGIGFAVGGALCGANPVVGWALLLTPNVVMQAFLLVLYGLRGASENAPTSTVLILA